MFRRFAVVALCALVPPVPMAQAWTWPVNGPVLRPFSFDRAHPYAAGQHRGVDLAAPAGTNEQIRTKPQTRDSIAELPKR